MLVQTYRRLLPELCRISLRNFRPLPILLRMRRKSRQPKTQLNRERFQPLAPLSDPEELLLIDGLDEEFQVLKIRDQDTNMILDMIQLITNRYILRPQNLPAVKITFDSMAVLTKKRDIACSGKFTRNERGRDHQN